jgi:hypothetical protein
MRGTDVHSARASFIYIFSSLYLVFDGYKVAEFAFCYGRNSSEDKTKDK